jgi:poly(A) polymerase
MRLTGAWVQDRGAQAVCAMLQSAGYQAWFVGGCVRNALMGLPVADIDLSTDARPDVVMALAKASRLRAIPTGIAHGTVTLIAHGTAIEVTTFRRDVATDGRRAVVAFADDMADDARRRDFTMNALYAGADGTVCDPLGGLANLQARQVRFIGDPGDRIREDYLRILRFFRFHAHYGGDGIDADGLAAVADHLDGLADLSRERITAEMLKLLAAPDPGPALAAMAATGVLGMILPGADARAVPVLVHIEQDFGWPPSALRRLALLGGDAAAGLRLSKQQAVALDQLQSDLSLDALAYQAGADVARDHAAIRAAMAGQMLDRDVLRRAQFAANQVFPLSAADLMPRLQGAALGKALADAKARWIASGFTLTKDQLLAP